MKITYLVIPLILESSAVAYANYTKTVSDFEAPPTKPLDRGEKSFANTNNLVPVKKIPGTKLYTGIYYKVSMKTFPQGWVTWATKGHYIQIELTSSQLPNYAIGKPYQFDNQWMIGPTETKNGFTLTNRGKPYGFLVWVLAEVGSGYHVAVPDDPDSIRHMSAGGERRNDSSWIIHATNEENYYKLENMGKHDNYLTWTYKKHNNFNYYIELTYNTEDDSKFLFLPSDIKLEANVFDFVFEESLDDVLDNPPIEIKNLVAKKTFPNHSCIDISYTLEESLQTRHSVTISFKESFRMIHKTTLYVDMLMAAGGQEFIFDNGFEANQERLTEFTKTTTLKTHLKVPAHTEIEASVYTKWARHVEMPFIAKMKVVGVAERIILNHPDEVKVAYVPGDIVEDLITFSGGDNLDTISRSGDHVIVRVSGVIKGNPGFETAVITRGRSLQPQTACYQVA